MREHMFETAAEIRDTTSGVVRSVRAAVAAVHGRVPSTGADRFSFITGVVMKSLKNLKLNKLSLNKTTIRALGVTELALAHGGLSNFDCTDGGGFCERQLNSAQGNICH
jgi:hypothetical protein